ncbi:hypothetical protein ACLK2H_06000 [Escherichia coli]
MLFRPTSSDAPLLSSDYLIDFRHRSLPPPDDPSGEGAVLGIAKLNVCTDGLEGYPVYTRKVYTDVSTWPVPKKPLGVS